MDNHISVEDAIGKTVERVSTGTVPGAWGDEPVTYLHFTDGTVTGFVHPTDEDEPMTTPTPYGEAGHSLWLWSDGSVTNTDEVWRYEQALMAEAERRPTRRARRWLTTLFGRS